MRVIISGAMGSMAVAAAAGPAVVALSGCGSAGGLPTPVPSSSSSAPSTDSATGAMLGFLAAAADQDNGQVPAWLATSSERDSLAELLNVYSQFGSGTNSRLFWAVANLHVDSSTSTDSTHANVALNGPIVWCLGKSPGDSSATCAAVNGVAGMPHTYAAQSVDGRWKVDIDINASSQLDQNPQASPGSASASAG